MRKTKFRGFTLVELLAVIVILAIILVIAVPQIMNVIKSARISSIKDSALLIAEQAEKDYLSQQVLNKDYNSTSIPCTDVAKLNDDYASCKITYNNGVATVTLKGAENGKFAGITCKGTKDNMKCTESDGTIAAADNEDAVEYLEQLLDEETTSEVCFGTGKLIKVEHENGVIDYRYTGACPNNYATFNGEAPTVSTVYMMYADGDISTNSPRVGYQGGNEFPDETTCINQGLNGNFPSLGYESDTPAKCVLNTTTNKYYIEAHGYLLTDTGRYTTQSDCENAYLSQGMKSSSTPSGLSCKAKQVVTGGWRIIGIFNGRIKLMRDAVIGSAKWDSTSPYSNAWEGSEIEQGLNGNYLTSTGYLGKSLSSDAQNLIDNAEWYTTAITYMQNTSSAYNAEHTGTPISRKVGLIYPSDYGYASSACYNDSTKKLYDSTGDNCKNSNWMYTNMSSTDWWTIAPRFGVSSNASVVRRYGDLGGYGVNEYWAVRPVVYLKSNVKISGDGKTTYYTFS